MVKPGKEHTMSVEPHNVKSIFLAAVDKAPAERAVYLDEACAGDGALRRRVEELLAAHYDPASNLNRPILQDAARTLDTPGSRLAAFSHRQLPGSDWS
jgi:hypothetical protein